jgi:hypothetical protein
MKTLYLFDAALLMLPSLTLLYTVLGIYMLVGVMNKDGL